MSTGRNHLTSPDMYPLLWRVYQKRIKQLFRLSGNADAYRLLAYI